MVAAVRSLVGKNTLISASYDLHGNFSPRLAANLDMVTAFRTAPHIDEFETEVRQLASRCHTIEADGAERFSLCAKRSQCWRAVYARVSSQC